MRKKINNQHIILAIVFLLAAACHTPQKQVAVTPKAAPMTPHLATSSKDTVKVNKKLPKVYPIDPTSGQPITTPVVAKPKMVQIVKKGSNGN